MLTIYTTTFCRPDLVDFMSRAVRQTCKDDLTIIAYVHPGGLIRPWSAVDHIVYGTKSGFMAWTEIPKTRKPYVIIQDDCFPVCEWSQKCFPSDYCTRTDFGATLIYNNQSIDSIKIDNNIDVERIHPKAECPSLWNTFCGLAKESFVESLLGGMFLHLDKSTTTHPAAEINEHKWHLLELIAQKINIRMPEPLNKKELSVHPGVKLFNKPK